MNIQTTHTNDASTSSIDLESHGIAMIRLLLAGDNAIIRVKLRKILAQASNITVTGEVANSTEVLSQLKKGTSDLLLLDMDMPDDVGISLIKTIKAYRPALPIIILVMQDQTQLVISALKAGASGFIAKGGDPKTLLSAIYTVGIGDIYIDPGLSEQVAVLPRDNQTHTLLSVYELTVFLHLGIGKNADQIAEKLSMSTETVNNYKMRIMKKMNLQSSEDIIRYAMQHGLAD
ncbi:MAG: response regulator transcription factor [Nitrosospira sp.]|nr:response regulator transcription factor [Nitrosospira sp.]